MVPKLPATLLLLSLAAASVARADSSVGASDLEGVIVTAEKRPEPLGQTPMSVAVISGETLRLRHIDAFEDLPLLAPSLTFADAINSRGAGLQIRGVGTLSYSDGVASSVAEVVDGAPLGRQAASLFRFSDIAQVEVLRGPQGTLYGPSASAGVVSVTTRAPTRDFSVEGSASLASLDERHAELAISGPLAPSGLFGRAYVYGVKSDGFIDNLASGAKFNGADEAGARLKLLAEPAADWSLTATLDTAHRAEHCCAMTLRRVAPGTYYGKTYASLVGVTPGPNLTALDVDQPYLTNQWTDGATLAVTHDTKDLRFISITAARRFHVFDNNDRDLTPINIFDLNTSNERQGQLSEEVRVATAGQGPWTAEGGVFLQSQTLTAVTQSAGGFGSVTLPKVLGNQVERSMTTRTAALFGEAHWRFSDTLSLTLGARYTEDTNRARFQRSILPGAVGPSPSGIGGPPLVVPDLRAKDAKLSDRIALDYQVREGVMAYVSFARGFKGAGLNLLNFLTQNQVSSGAVVLAPEISQSAEAGLRARLFARRLDVNLTLYREAFHGFQTTAYDPQIAANTLTNAGALRAQGLEMESVWRPGGGASLALSLARNDAQFTNFGNSPCYPNELASGATPCHLTGTAYVQNISGRPLNNAPKWAVNFSPQWRGPVLQGRYDGFVGATYSWRSQVNFSPNQDPQTVQKAYGVADLNAGLIHGAWQVEVFVRNPFDQSFAANILPSLQSGSATTPAGYAQIFTLASRRSLGATVRLKY